ncbi:Uncharacterized conserved protein, DUF2336 family [Rhizobium sp. NFR07]|uniref:DUF2336 domain-containing protein n=1 Tax=Rhizobium sp. NFR07 TaxID=1566262 RepID=UPI0008E68901|nr:DUF2336 domain-containing protein [Rhizobium sp. NFR07]SFB36855.1 Uncharacterized conserved protein, DUF2336 family [Rhizobium sp. NFR07]
MIVQAFLRWAETARTSDRSRAAGALARAYLQSDMGSEEHRAAGMAMTYLLDDPSPKVRLALAEALALSPEAPRAIVLALAEDQPEIACTVIAMSPVLRDADLVDLAGRGHAFTRGLIAARPGLGRSAAAAIAEIGEEAEIGLLLENETASISRLSLRRMAERFGHVAGIRHLLLQNGSLPGDARHILVAQISAALAGSGLIQATISRGRIEVLTREAGDEAAIAIAGSVSHDEIEPLVEHLRVTNRLTPALLIHALCGGKVDFFACAIVSLVNLDERRVRAILATGRIHAVRALFEAAGIGRDIVAVFVEAVFQWRRMAAHGGPETCYLALIEAFGSRESGTPIGELIEMIEQLHRSELRRHARSYASDISLVA